MNQPRHFPYQLEGIKFLTQNRCGLLADEMGLGKTVQAIGAVKKLFEERAIERVLIVAPFSLVSNWRSEFQRWCPDIPCVPYGGQDRFGMLRGGAKLLITTYETLVADNRAESKDGSLFVDLGLDLVILDEAQLLKAADSIRSKVLSRIVAARRWAITGTPLENRPQDLSAILRFLFPGDFESEEDLSDIAHMMRLRDRVMLRRTKAEVGLQLPRVIRSEMILPLGPEQSAEYEQHLLLLREQMRKVTSPKQRAAALLSALQKLRRIAVISSNGDSSKLDFLELEAEKFVPLNEKAVVFSSFAELVLPAAKERLSRFGSLMYVGTMSADQRDEATRLFVYNPTYSIMLASVKAAGVGLNWTSANRVYHLDTWWNPQSLAQADARVHRIGQKKGVISQTLISDETIERQIVRLLETKKDIFDIVVNRKAPSPSQSLRIFSAIEDIGIPFY